jgi:hypothetical protein
MNTEWKQLSGIEEVTAARDAGLEIEVDILDEWKPWNGEFSALLDQVWFKDLKYRARHRKLAKVLVKRICWTSIGGNLTWTKEDYQFYSKDWKRFPAGDLFGEVDE